MDSHDDESRLTRVILHPCQVQCIPRTGTALRGGTRAAPGHASPCHPGSGYRDSLGSSGILGEGIVLSILLEVSTPNSPPQIHHPAAAHASVPAVSCGSKIIEFAGKTHRSSCQCWQVMAGSDSGQHFGFARRILGSTKSFATDSASAGTGEPLAGARAGGPETSFARTVG